MPELREIGQFASEQGIHLTYIVDTCNAGALVTSSQGRQLFDLSDLDRQVSSGDRPRFRHLGSRLAAARNANAVFREHAAELRWLTRHRSEVDQVQARDVVDGLVAPRKALTKALRAAAGAHAAWQAPSELHGYITLRLRVLEALPTINRGDLRGLQSTLPGYYRAFDDAVRDVFAEMRAMAARGEQIGGSGAAAGGGAAGS